MTGTSPTNPVAINATVLGSGVVVVVTNALTTLGFGFASVVGASILKLPVLSRTNAYVPVRPAVPSVKLFGLGVQIRLLNDGLNESDPDTVPTNDPVPALGPVWFTVNVNVTPDGKLWSDPGVQDTHCVLNEPKSTSEPLRKLFDPTGTNDSVKPLNAQLVAVQPPPLNAPAVEKVTVWAASGTTPSTAAAPAILTARAILPTAMLTSFP